jgi:uncharacterized protein (TIGR03435 family)
VPPHHHLSLVLALLLVASSILAPGMSSGLAQQSAEPRFEVSSVKRNMSGDAGGGMRLVGARFEATNVPAWMLVMDAYGLRSYELAAERPAWVDQELFDVRATAGRVASRNEFRQMVRAMLAERFKLAVHREPREVRGYSLVVANRGGKLGPGLGAPCQADCPPEAGFEWTSGLWEEHSTTMADIANALSEVMRSPVANRTALPGTYSVKLRWAVDAQSAGAPEAQAVSFRRAAEDELGLKLESGRVRVEVLVIDAIERPTPD